MKRALLLASLLAVATAAFGQKANLTQQDIDTAIAVGRAAKGATNAPFGLVLTKRLLSVYGPPDLTVYVFSPTTMIEVNAAKAAVEYRDYTPSEFDKAPELTVIVQSDEQCYNVRAIVLKNATKIGVLKPVVDAPMERKLTNAYGASVTCTDRTARFLISDVQALRRCDFCEIRGGKIFLVAVIDGWQWNGPQEEEFELGEAEFNKLP